MNRITEVSAHTPGPWTASMEYDFVECASQVVCQMWDKMEEDFPNKEANARLIAAAPELLDALRYLLMVREIECTHAHPGPDLSCANCRARAAIASATGGTR